jgi:sentrin-specific protease 1
MERKHFRCLQSGEWLNDEVINFYMGMLQERSDAEAAAAASGGATQRRVWFANTFFLTKLRENGYCYDNVRNWTREGSFTRVRTLTKVLDMDLIVIPRHVGVHWTCVVVDVPARTVTHYDSMGRVGGTAHEDLARVVRWLCEEAREKCGTTMEAGDWQTLDLGVEAPQQHNGW